PLSTSIESALYSLGDVLLSDIKFQKKGIIVVGLPTFNNALSLSKFSSTANRLI
ncbi:MAG: hypothetical protein ACI9T7_003346, partial [Oleiphilaceae bacterium]